MSTKTERRSEVIMKQLLGHGEATVEELVELTGTSSPSIRRDLIALERRGLIRRTHGGAALVEPLLYEPFRYDESFQAREQRNAAQKRHIGLAAAGLVNENEVIGLTAGTTTTQIGRSLRHRQNIQVVTNAINIAMELCNQHGLRTFLLGGLVQHAWSFSLTGPHTGHLLDALYLDKLFIGGLGIDVERGITTIEYDEAETFRGMAARARKIIAVLDSSKIGVVKPAVICPINQVKTLITGVEATREQLEPFRALGIEVIQA
jgi:DeoR family transcriptional regulator of aga operon